MRLAGTKLAANHQYRGFGDQLYDLSGQRPSLDLNFANTKSLVDATTGQNLVTFTRASSGTYVDSQGVIRTATTNLLLRSEEFDDAYWTKNNLQFFGSGSIANAIAAPNGTITADKIVENTVNAQHMVFRGITPEGGLRYTLSFYAKAAERSFVIGAFSGGGLASDCTVGINLTNGSVVSTSNIPDIATATLVGDGWYRVVLSKTLPSSASVQPRIIISTNGTTQGYTGDGTSGLFIWGAQLEQSSTVGEYIPTTGTINSAPRFDHNPTTGESLGLLVEEQRTNLCLQSEAWDTSPWTSTAPYSVTVNAIASPDGTQTADALIVASGSSSFTTNVTRQVITKAASAIQYTRSAYFKALGSTTSVRVSDFGSSTANSASAVVSLVDGSIVTAPSVAGTFSGVSVAVSNAGNGWWRVAFTYTTDTATSLTIRSFPYVGAGVLTGDGSSGLYVWGAQLEAGSFATSYIPTTTATVTRSADVASITGANFGVSRTNLLLQSEEFDNAYWTKTGTTAVNPNTVIAPDGTLTGDTLTGATNTVFTASAINLSRTNIAVPSGATCTFSVWVKRVNSSSTTIAIRARDVTNATNFTGVTHTPTNDDWVRLTSVFTLGAGGVSVHVLIGGQVGDFYIWGAQLETGSAATAYIPTTSAAVTVVDSPWYRQDEGTLYGDYLERAFSQTHQVLSVSNGTASERISMAVNSSNVLDLAVISSGVDTFTGNTPTLTAQAYRIGFAYKSDSSGVSANGSAVTDDSAVILPTVSQLDVGARGSSQILNSTIRRLTYFPTRLANETLQRITQ